MGLTPRVSRDLFIGIFRKFLKIAGRFWGWKVEPHSCTHFPGSKYPLTAGSFTSEISINRIPLWGSLPLGRRAAISQRIWQFAEVCRITPSCYFGARKPPRRLGLCFRVYKKRVLSRLLIAPRGFWLGRKKQLSHTFPFLSPFMVTGSHFPIFALDAKLSIGLLHLAFSHSVARGELISKEYFKHT